MKRDCKEDMVYPLNALAGSALMDSVREEKSERIGKSPEENGMTRHAAFQTASTVFGVCDK